MSEFRESLKEKGYATTPIDLTRDDMESTIMSYLEFLNLDGDVHHATQFYMTDRGDGDFGQFSRRAGMNSLRGEVPDTKDIFHFGAQTRQIVESRLYGMLPRELREFLSQAEEIYWSAQRTKLNALDELDVLHMGLRACMFDERQAINDVLRFIAYYPDPNKLAKGHFDRSVCTLAIGESHEGLRITAGQNGLVVDADGAYMSELDGRLAPVEHREGEAKFFLGAGWNRLEPHRRFGNQEMPLGWHDVIPSDKSVNDRIMRWAIVLFANPHLGEYSYVVPTPPETRPHKNLGRLTIDQSYQMSTSQIR
jgi:hypothetical protein